MCRRKLLGSERGALGGESFFDQDRELTKKGFSRRRTGSTEIALRIKRFLFCALAALREIIAVDKVLGGFLKSIRITIRITIKI